MRNLQELLGRLSLAGLKKLSAFLPKARKKYSDALANRDKLEKYLPSDFSWAPLYELEINELLILGLAILGLLDRLNRADRAGLDLNQYLLEETARATEADEEEEWAGGHGGMFTEADLLGTTHAVQNSVRCQSIYGHYLNDLVKQVREGGSAADDAFFNAVRIDRTVLTCPTFSSRLARAEYFGEKEFMDRLKDAVSGKPHDALLVHQDLRSMLQVFQDAKALDDMSLKDADYLFIKELKLYQDAGKDPARSLMRFIQRWRAQIPSAT